MFWFNIYFILFVHIFQIVISSAQFNFTFCSFNLSFCSVDFILENIYKMLRSLHPSLGSSFQKIELNWKTESNLFN